MCDVCDTYDTATNANIDVAGRAHHVEMTKLKAKEAAGTVREFPWTGLTGSSQSPNYNNPYPVL